MANAGTYNHTKQHFAEGSAAATPDASEVVIYAKTDGLLYSKDDAGTETLMSSGAALSNPMTTAEDIIVGGASGTPGRLAVGTEGQVLSVSSGAVAWADAAGGGGISSGTSFPGSPTAGDLYFRTDHDLLFTYDGTRWVTVTLYRDQFMTDTGGAPPVTDNKNLGKVASWFGDFDMWMVKAYVAVFVASTNSGSAYWTIDIDKVNTANSSTEVGTVNTSADSPGAWLKKEITIGAALGGGATYPSLTMTGAKTGSPGALYWIGGMTYRLIGT